MKGSVDILLKICLVFIFTAFFTCEELLLEDDITQEIVEVIAPTDNSVLTITTVNFSWEPIEFADKYHLQIAVPSFQNALQVVEDTLITQTNFTKSLVPENYEWRVKALNSAYQTSYTTQAFSIEE
jgi:hypothetical protein